WVSVKREVGVAKTGLVGLPWFGRARGLFPQLINESKQRFLRVAQLAEFLLHNCRDLPRSLACFGIRRYVRERRAVRFEPAELHIKKIIFAQSVSQLLRIPPQQLEQLLIRQQMPVSFDNGDVRTPLLVCGDTWLFRQTHPGR